LHITLVIAVLAVFGIAIYLLRDGHAPSQPPQPAGETETKAEAPSAEAEPSETIVPSEPSTLDAQPSGGTVTESKVAQTNEYVKKPGQMKLPNGRVLTFKPPEEGHTTKVISNGHIYECDSEGNYKEVTPPPIFDNRFENQLVGLSLSDGTFMPGMLKNHSEEEIMAMLKKQVVINEDDSDEVKTKKEAVAEMKGIILDYIAQGGTFDQFVDEMHSFAREERRLKSKAYKRILADIKEGKIEEARKFREEYDSILEKNGYSKLTIPRILAEELDKDADQ
jgi:hypothetical protein